MATKRGKWAGRNTPAWCFNVFQVAERLGVSVRWAKELIRRYQIPVGRLKRPVKMPSGIICMRQLVVITPTALQKLLARHVGLSLPNDLTGAQQEDQRHDE